jgi:hypothetical protein
VFLPAVAVLIVNLATHEPPELHWDVFPLKWLPLALFLIPAVLHTVMLPLTASLNRGVPWQDWLHAGTDR